jgi:DNA-directed RNA polymerase specialized sigma24 family protein
MQKIGKEQVVGLFTEHRERLHRYLRSRLANDADAQELAQEAFLRLLRISRTELIKHPQAYLK